MLTAHVLYRDHHLLLLPLASARVKQSVLSVHLVVCCLAVSARITRPGDLGISVVSKCYQSSFANFASLLVHANILTKSSHVNCTCSR